MASKAFPHVILRGDTYHYHRRVPQTVIDRTEAHQRLFGGQRLFRRSLRTQVYREALAAAAIAAQEFELRVNEALAQLPAAVEPQRTLSTSALGDVSSFIRDGLIRDWRSHILRAEIDEDHAEYLHWRINKVIGRSEDTDEATALLDEHPVDRARSINRAWGFNLNESSDEFAELVAAVRDGCISARQGIQDLFSGKSLPDQPTSSLIKLHGPANRRATTRRFSEVVAEHMQTGQFAAKTLAKMRRSHDLFIRAVGDKPIGEIARHDVILFLDALSTQEVGAASGKPRRITRETMQSYLTQVSSPLTWAIERGWMDEPNPAKGFNLGRWGVSANPMHRRRRFDVGELNKLFQHSWFSGCKTPAQCYESGSFLLDDMRYWAPVLALYTGARAGELGGMRLDEIVLDDPHPHILIQCNRYRNTKSRLDRHVPVLDALLALGFGEYVKRVRAAGSDRLFPDWDIPPSGGAQSEFFNWANAKWIRAFNRTVLGTVFPQLTADGGKSPLVFHSFRGSFKVLLLNNAPRHVAHAILGHNQDELDKSYIGQLSPAETHGVVRSVDYLGIKIPSRADLAR